MKDWGQFSLCIPKDFKGAAKKINERDYEWAAASLNCDLAAIKAVAEVESEGRGGFLKDKRPVILFEAHYFSRLTGHLYDKSHPDISSRRWNRTLYKGGALEYKRLMKARHLDPAAALQSCSWGMFQVMGANYKIAGAESVFGFVELMCHSEGDHLVAMVKYCLSVGLADEIRELRWDDFARIYNGPGYRKNNYHGKLARAYEKYKQSAKEGYINWPPLDVIQARLNEVSRTKITVDGVRGPKTRAAIMDFQCKNGLVVDGIVGRKTLEALGFDV